MNSSRWTTPSAERKACRKFSTAVKFASSPEGAGGKIFASSAPRKPMPNPAFVHLRLHSEFSITDGIVRIDEAVARAAADGMPALAITDLANVFGMVKFYKAARAAGVKPIIGCDVWITNESERDKPHRLLLLTQSRPGYLRLSELLTRAWLDNQYRGRAELRKAWFGEGTEGLIALSGAMQGDVAAALLQDHPEHAMRIATEWARLFPGRFYLELQRAGAPQTESYVEAAVRLAGSCSLPVVATHPVQFLKPEDFTAHEARVCIAEGHVLGDQRRPRQFTQESYFPIQAEMAKLFADLPEALANSIEIARRCNLALELGKPRLPVFPTPPGMSREEYLRQQAQDGLERRLVANYASRADERWKEKYDLRLEIELRPSVRALPESGARIDARLRHRLLRARARPGDRVRQAEIRSAIGVADRDLRHDGGARRGARRRARHGMELHAHGRTREAHSLPARQAHHASGCARDGAAARAARKDRGRDARAARARRAARRSRAQRRHARRGRADRPGQAHRFLPALRGSRDREHDLAIRHEGRRAHRPGEVRFPRPHHAHRSRLGGAVDPRDGEARFLAREDPARRSRRLRGVRPRQHHGDIPVRIARHARSRQARAARPLRGHHRARRALPPRADGAHPRVRRAQERQAGRIPRSTPGADPETHLRDHGVPGAGDADRAGDGRLLARQRRPPAPRDGEKGRKGDGAAARRVRRRRREEPPAARQGDPALRPDGEVRGLRVQQVARG